jgi:hypothetical protein
MHITIEYATPLPGSAYQILKKEVSKYPYNLEDNCIREKVKKFCGRIRSRNQAISYKKYN